MSTLGKVLVILIVLAVLGWMFLASLVAQYNINWGKRLQEVQKEVEELKVPLPALRVEISKNTTLANNEQLSVERARLIYRANLAMAQKTESETKETLERFTAQHTAAELAQQAAVKRAEKRLAERTELENQITQEKATVAALIADNKAKKDTLAGLRQAFISTVAECKTFMEQLKKPSPGATVTPRTRLGSFVR